MNRLILATAVAAFIATATAAAAQTKTITGEVKTVRYTVEAIDSASRTVTVKKEDGTYDSLFVPNTVRRFDTLKVGDRIAARHYENIILQLKAPGSKDVDTAALNTTTPAQGKGGTIANQRTITATIAAIDPKVPSITFTGPGGFKYSTRVEDKAALAKVKVGDKLDITWTQAVIVDIEDAK